MCKNMYFYLEKQSYVINIINDYANRIIRLEYSLLCKIRFYSATESVYRYRQDCP